MEENSLLEEGAQIPAGRGRGRGRGAGVPVLPAGLWQELNNESKGKDTRINEKIAEFDQTNRSKDNEHENEDFNTTNSSAFLDAEERTPIGFGRGRGRGRGRGKGRGRGLERDVNGPDWDCTLCGNTNWSWRSNCNRCQTAKPITLQVRNIYIVIII